MKALGYIISIIGIAGISAYSVPEIKLGLGLAKVSDFMLIIISLIVTLLGIFIIVKKGGRSKQPKEVPIFHGKNVVGYRRH